MTGAIPNTVGSVCGRRSALLDPKTLEPIAAPARAPKEEIPHVG